MKHYIILAGVLLVLAQAPASAADFEQLRQKTQKLLPEADTRQELNELTDALLLMYLWSKDNFEVRQWTEWAALDKWPSFIQEQRKQFKHLSAEFDSLEAAYWLLLHDYRHAQQLIQNLPIRTSSPYPSLLKALMGEPDPENSGVWRISLTEARQIQKRFPRLNLAALVLVEALLERVPGPGRETELLKESQRQLRLLLRRDKSELFAHYQQGQLLYLQQKPEEAHKYFEQHVATQGALASESVANFYTWMQEPVTALDFLERARQLQPRSLRIYQKMEQVYLQTRPPEAAHLYLRGLAQVPDMPEFYDRLRENYEQVAPEQLRRWVKAELPAQSYLSRLILGDLALREQDVKTAHYWYEKALAKEPKRIEAYLNLLELYWEKRDTASIVKLLDQAATNKVQTGQTLDYWRAVILVQEGRVSEAIKLLEPLARTDGRARFTLARAYRQQNSFDKARELIASLIEQDPQNVLLVLELGDIYLEERSLEEAEKVYQIALRMEPYNPAVFFSLGNLYSETRRFELAIDAFERGILLAPADLDLRNNLGNVFLRQKLFADAEQQFQAIVARRPDYAAAYYNLACVYALNQQADMALRYLRRAIELDGALKQSARKDEDLAHLQNDPRFQELVR